MDNYFRYHVIFCLSLLRLKQFRGKNFFFFFLSIEERMLSSEAYKVIAEDVGPTKVEK